MTEKIAIVTGGAGDIGRAIVIKLAEDAFKVFAVDIDEQKLIDLKDIADKKKLEIFPLCSDVRDYKNTQQNIDYIASNYASPSVLVTCAGIRIDKSILNITEEDFDNVIKVNLYGTFNYVKAITPYIKKNNYGKIVTISSINALRGKRGQLAYTTAKAGIIGLAKTAAIELGKYNANVNVVAPGMINTSMISNLSPEIIFKATNESVLGKIGEPEDVANLVMFLISEKSKHITGNVFKVDGGQYI